MTERRAFGAGFLLGATVTSALVYGIVRCGLHHHVYLSTSCFHGEHDYCKAKAGRVGAKVPATCKFCGAPCICRCHQEDT